MNDWQTQVDKLLEDYEGITHDRYAAGLASFRAWYLQSYSDEPDVTLLTDDEVRDYRFYLTCVKGYKAATVNEVPGADLRHRARSGSNAQGQGRDTSGAGVTYANWFSYRTADFISENREIYRALRITRALFPGTRCALSAIPAWMTRRSLPKWPASMASSSSESSTRTDWWKSTTSVSSAGRGQSISTNWPPPCLGRSACKSPSTMPTKRAG